MPRGEAYGARGLCQASGGREMAGGCRAKVKSRKRGRTERRKQRRGAAGSAVDRSEQLRLGGDEGAGEVLGRGGGHEGVAVGGVFEDFAE